MYGQVPPAPPFPEELHLRPVCGVVWNYLGDEDGAKAAMAPLLDNVPEPLLHGVAGHAALRDPGVRSTGCIPRVSSGTGVPTS